MANYNKAVEESAQNRWMCVLSGEGCKSVGELIQPESVSGEQNKLKATSEG